MPVVVIAGALLKEALRRRVLLALAGLTLAVIAVMTYGFAQVPHLATGRGGRVNHDDLVQIAGIFQILSFFMFSFVLTFAAVFVAAPSIAGELESGVLLALVPRPMRRTEILLGKWLGASVLVGVYAVSATAVELAAVRLVTGYLPPHPVEAIAFLVAEGAVAVTLGTLFSTRMAPMTGGIVAAVLLLGCWFAGVIGNVGYSFGNDSVAALGTVSRLLLPTDGMWRGSLYYLQTDALIQAQALLGRRAYFNPFYAAQPPGLAYLAWVAGWIAGMLALSAWSFERREL